MSHERVAQVGKLFDAVAPTYDQVGVEFFGPVARHLARLVAPAPGETVVELGCGRGALTLPLAAAVGPTGMVRACDVSAAMVAAAQDAARGLSQVHVELMDAGEPTYAPGSADVVASSLVIFFLPDPTTALHRWVGLLAPGGRLGLTTFGEQDQVWQAVDALFDPYLPATMLDARTSGKLGPFASDDALADLVRTSGCTTVSTETQRVTVHLEDVAAWRRWTMSVGQRTMWGFVPPDEVPRVVERAAELLELTRDDTGMVTLWQDVRHTTGTVA